MTKKDTIIVTALVNAGVLVILFVSALKNDGGKEEFVLKPKSPDLSVSEVVIHEDTKKVLGDEVDRVLKLYTEQNPLQAQASTPSLQAPISFVDDLKSVAEPSAKEPTSLLAVEPPPQESVKTPALINPPPLQEVVVKKGDMLEKLAKQHRTSVSEIMKVNHLTTTQLRIGQVLKMPAPKVVAIQESQEKQEKKPLDPTSAKYYTVKAGDNLWTIAVKNHIKVEDLLKLNGLNEEKARKLKPGDRIRIQ
ncbi:MAG: LysM peptidoglycan-binding domain-containing protein [Chlamydiae bacterium]|nr:LysM peptidoglycan-binding domain-containing protein [Chlamydiota bacterium]